ncbi:MAG: hypothetical protein CMP61_07855 [Flavobacteriales bacterium]|nr:hypothetical protein [Flavobacteriales bacterium]|tara:strand:- start:27992 stop:28450 length:459 start_codon:yes stop_codon:yes gene_type:complete
METKLKHVFLAFTTLTIISCGSYKLVLDNELTGDYVIHFDQELKSDFPELFKDKIIVSLNKDGSFKFNTNILFGGEYEGDWEIGNSSSGRVVLFHFDNGNDRPASLTTDTTFSIFAPYSSEKGMVDWCDMIKYNSEGSAEKLRFSDSTEKSH